MDKITINIKNGEVASEEYLNVFEPQGEIVAEPTTEEVLNDLITTLVDKGVLY